MKQVGGHKFRLETYALNCGHVGLQDLPARFGRFLHEAFAFDAAAFSIATAEAVLMDPQQRLLLESVAEALHGSVPAASATDSSVAVGQQGAVGVFIGISTPDYADLAKAYSTISPYSSTGAVLGFELIENACWITVVAQFVLIVKL